MPPKVTELRLRRRGGMHGLPFRIGEHDVLGIGGEIQVGFGGNPDAADQDMGMQAIVIRVDGDDGGLGGLLVLRPGIPPATAPATQPSRSRRGTRGGSGQGFRMRAGGVLAVVDAFISELDMRGSPWKSYGAVRTAPMTAKYRKINRARRPDAGPWIRNASSRVRRRISGRPMEGRQPSRRNALSMRGMRRSESA